MNNSSSWLRRLRLGAMLLIAVSLCGCQQNGARLFQPPGTIGYQRSQAVLHDPFPSHDLGPPVLGGRPREFDRPLPEVVDSQTSPFTRQGAPVQPNYGF